MLIGALQLCSSLEPTKNLRTIRKLLAKAKEKKVQAVFLPECFYSLSNGEEPTPYLIERGVERGNEHYESIRRLARDYELYILGGSAATFLNGKIYNRCYNLDPIGEELEIYDKIHLFSCDVPITETHNIDRKISAQRKVLDERKIFTSGTQGKILRLGEFKIGLSICFDVRFPELYREYARQGANVLSVSSAFTVPTGKAHWHTLLRARAIENQSYVVAAAQWGQNNEKVSTFGHSLIIDPWGQIMADAGEGEQLITAKLDLSYLKEIRSRMSVLPRE